jgi:MFS family permease
LFACSRFDFSERRARGGVTLSGVGINVVRTLGFAFGGFVVVAAGLGIVFVLDVLSFLGVVGALARRRKRSHRPPRRAHSADLAERFARPGGAQRVLRTFLFMVCGAAWALMFVLGRETGCGVVGFGLLFGSFGVGVVVGVALLFCVRARVASEVLIGAGSFAFAVVAIGVATFRGSPSVHACRGCRMDLRSDLTVGAQQASPLW